MDRSNCIDPAIPAVLVTDVLSRGHTRRFSAPPSVRKITFCRNFLPYFPKSPRLRGAVYPVEGRAVKRARFARSWAKASRANLAGTVGFLLAARGIRGAGDAGAAQGLYAGRLSAVSRR